ncbi:biotin/lipoyl-containing protein [Sulfolobus tengchongensis]|uniref:Biotin/lipoyl-containing protein n=1 Tax=Sulfolobus tengchongensis TaxID=207809 RepID=A0AAX4KZ52_9CREN
MQVELKVPEDIWPRRRDWGGEVVSVYVKEGNEVNVGDLIAEVEIEKAILKILSQYKGRVVKVLVSEGDKITPGSVIAIIEV